MADSFEKPGWPRPRAPYDPNSDDRNYIGKYWDPPAEHPRKRFAGMLPAPWIIESHAESDNVIWTKFHSDASRAHDERLCQVCGFKLNKIIMLMATEPGGLLETSGPGLHPRCAALSLRFCPHLIELTEKNEIVGFLYTGDDVGYILGEYDDAIGPYTNPHNVDPDSLPLKAEEIIKLAKLSPMGDKRRNHEEEDPKDQ